MSKRVFLGVFAAAGMLLATSCQNDELDVVQTGNEVTVSFTLGVESGVGTRAISDGLKAKKLVYALYNADGDLIKTIKDADANGQFVDTEAFANGLNHKVNVTLAKGQTYTVVFWAQSNACEAYTTTDLENVTVTYGAAPNNDESRDAFFAAKEFVVTGHEEIDVTLKRPFAQINLGVTNEDWDAAVASEINVKESKVVIKNAATKINLLNGDVSGETEVTYEFAATPKSSNEVLKVDLEKDGTVEEYHYLSMSYILVGAQKSTLQDLDFTFHPQSGNDIVFDLGLNNVPVQRNWRTNIIGQILTGNITYNLTIDPIYDGEYNNGTPYPVLLNNIYYKTIEDALAVAVSGDVIELAAGEYALPHTISLTGTAVGTVTFAGQGKETVINGAVNTNSNYPGNYANGLDLVFKNLTYETANNGYNGGFGHAASVEFEECQIIGQYYAHSGAPHSFTNCTIDPLNGYLYTYGSDCTFESCTFSSSEGKALQVYAEADPGVESTVTINNCTFTADKIATTWDGKPVTAIDINSIRDNKFNVNINNTTATGYGTGIYSGSSLWNIKGGEENVTVTIDGKKVNDAVDVNGVKYGTLEAALAQITDNGIVSLAQGTYIIPETAAKGKTLSFVGTGDPAKTVIECTGSHALNGSTATFENLTIKTANENYQGFYHVVKATYKNCIIKNMYTLYGPSEFTACTFSVSGDVYNVWTYGTNSTFTDCTFYCDGKAVYVYNEAADTDDNVTFNKCVFNDKEGLVGETKAAIETGANHETVKHTININNCTVNGFNVTSDKTTEYNWRGDSFGTNVWGNKYLMTRDNLNVVIDGTEVY